jgi:DNA repair protein RadC
MADTLAPAPILIKDLPATERPRERLRDFGAEVLSSAELIAILLRTGMEGKSALAVAHELLSRFGGLGGLAQASHAELCNAPGLGPAKAAELRAAITLGVRAASVAPETKPLVRSPEDAANLVLGEMSLLDQEEVRVLILDRRLQLVSTSNVYRGSVHTVAVRFPDIFRDAVRCAASGIVVVHNHPSGDPTPSAADIAMTKGLVEAGKLLDIDVQDHMVVGGGRYVSMRTTGLGFPREAS